MHLSQYPTNHGKTNIVNNGIIYITHIVSTKTIIASNGIIRFVLRDINSLKVI